MQFEKLTRGRACFSQIALETILLPTHANISGISMVLLYVKMSGTWHAAEANVCSLSTVFDFYIILTDLAFLSQRILEG